MKYWQERLRKQQEIVYNRSAVAADKKLAKLYTKLARNIKGELWDVLSSIGQRKEGVLMSDLYRSNKYFELLGKYNQMLTELGAEEIKVIEPALLRLYNQSASIVSKEFNIAAADGAKQAVAKIWAPDGIHWSERVWRNKNRMMDKLQQGITDAVSAGKAKDRIVSEISKSCGVEWKVADRLVRTQMSYVYNEAAYQSYKQAGVEKYEVIGDADDDLCQCGEVFEIANYAVGQTAPPFHPHCRCSIVPLIEI